MSGKHDPFMQGRRLRSALRDLRAAQGLTQEAVAKAFEWSKSKVVRIESGESSVSANDLKALLDLYRVEDAQRRAELIEMARDSRGQSWSVYRDIFTRDFLMYLSYESSAAKIRSYEPLIVPGWLQTDEYMRAVVRAVSGPEVSDQMVNSRVEARLKRQDLLDGDGAPHLHVIIDEAALRRRVAPQTRTMRRQLEHLVAMAERPNITIQVLPFAAGEHPGMAGAFICLEFPDSRDDGVVFLERARWDVFTRDVPEETQRYLAFFSKLEGLALAPSEITDVIGGILRDE